MNARYSGSDKFGITSSGATVLSGLSLLLQNGSANDTYGIYNAGGSGTSTVSFRYGGSDKLTLDTAGNMALGAGGTASANTALTINSSNATNYGGYVRLEANGAMYAAVGDYAALVSGATHQLICRNTSAGVYLSGGGATSWTAVSDERFKENLVPITDAATKVSSLRAVVGNYIESFDPEKTRKPFLIAQDVLAVLPEAVSTDNPDQLGLSMTDVVPLLVAAIKELTARLAALEAK